MIETIKFSQMTSGGDLANNEKTPGLLSGGNVLFNNPWTFLPPGSTADRPTPSATINYRLRFNTDNQLYEYYDAVLGVWTQLQESAFTQGPFVIYEADAFIPAAQNLGALADGILKQTVSLGSATIDIAVNDIDYYGPGMTGFLQAPAGVKDSQGNILLLFAEVLNAANYLVFANTTAGAGPLITVDGSDTDIQLIFATKGTDPFIFGTTGNTAFVINSGTLGQHSTNLIFQNTAATRDVTFQDASGTVAFLSDLSPLVWAINANASISASSGNGYILTSGSPTTISLPTTFAAGDLIGISGFGAAWTANIGAATNVQSFGDTYTTSIASANNTDSIVLIGLVANTTWGILSLVTKGFTAS